MQRLDVIEVSEPSEWYSPMVVVPKRDATVRICVDYGKVNQFVQREHYHLPTAKEIFAKMKGAKYFSTLDAAAGFWQIPLDPTSSPLTTFITPFGRFRFKRIPFGLSSEPEVFHQTMHHILSGLEGVDCFIDDVIIWGSTREEHDQRVRRVLERLRDTGVKLQAAKCKFRLQEVTYYGHILSTEEIKVSPRKVQAITQMQCPENKDDLRRFLGLFAYVAKFLKNKAQLTAPLRELLKDDVPWCWNAVHEEALPQLKKMITTAPVLAYYSPHVRTVVSADASLLGIGVVLFQVQKDGRRVPVTYISRSLSADEQRVSQIRKEALAMAWACEKLHCYVFGTEQPFLIETNHRPLESIMNRYSIDECPPRLMWLKLRMMRYCFRV